MKCLLSVVFALALAATASASTAKVYIFVVSVGAEGFAAPPRLLMDSAKDLRNAVNRVHQIAYTTHREAADLVVQITAREEAQGEYRVHAHVTTRDGAETDLTGASVHQWSGSALDIATQLSGWAKAHQAEITRAAKGGA